MMIRNMTQSDFQEVMNIYQVGIDSNQCTFETILPTWEGWDESHLEVCRLIAIERKTQRIIGFAALAPMSSRWCFRGVAEVSIYLKPSAQGRGVGFFLLQELIKESEKNGIWSLFSGIFPENESSIRLHEKCGFRRIGVRERLGESFDGTFRDVVFYERRSQIIG